MKRLISSCLFMVASSISMAEVDPFYDESGDTNEPVVIRHIRVQIMFYELSSSTWHEKITPASNPGSSILEKVTELTKSGEAKLINMSILSCQSGERATAESVREIIYPTETEPPEFVHSMMKFPVPPRPYFATPTAFETRNVGETLQIEPSFTGDLGEPIDLRIEHEMVAYPRNTVWTEYRDQWGKADAFFPEFDTQRTVTNLTLANNKTQFLNSYTPNRTDGKPDIIRKILVFVKATEIHP